MEMYIELLQNKLKNNSQETRDDQLKLLEKKIKEIEIIPGKGSGQLKKKVLRFLDKPEIKKLYHRIEKDRDNFGKIFVYFKY